MKRKSSTTIKISRSLAKELRVCKTYSRETYEDVIRKALKNWRRM